MNLVLQKAVYFEWYWPTQSLQRFLLMDVSTVKQEFKVTNKARFHVSKVWLRGKSIIDHRTILNDKAHCGGNLQYVLHHEKCSPPMPWKPRYLHGPVSERRFNKLWLCPWFELVYQLWVGSYWVMCVHLNNKLIDLTDWFTTETDKKKRSVYFMSLKLEVLLHKYSVNRLSGEKVKK